MTSRARLSLEVLAARDDTVSVAAGVTFTGTIYGDLRADDFSGVLGTVTGGTVQ